MTWDPMEADTIDEILTLNADPLRTLAAGETPAIILRGAYAPADCKDLVRRFLEHDLMRDPALPAKEGDRRRIDIGTSLGNRGADQEAFLEHAEGTRELFSHLFEGMANPVSFIYDSLQQIAGPRRRVQTAEEPDGRAYGPAIFRIHYDGHAYPPHIDHVTLREKRFNYAVSRFTHQFAGILCVQNAVSHGATQGVLHHCLWSEQIQPQLRANTFHEYAAQEGIDHCQVDLEPGDLYFFNTRNIHEVPAVEGTDPRIVLAVFIGFNAEDDEIFVWA